jgi:hypothetical protein
MKKLCPLEDDLLSGVLPQDGNSSTSREFRPEPELPANLIKRPIWIWPSGFRSELFQTHGKLGEVSYWDKTTPFIYMRGSWPIKFLSIQSTQHNTSINYLSFIFSSPLLLVLCLRCMDGGLTTAKL